MSRLSIIALLSMSLALPSVSSALGLGDIHVASALHQPLAAQIDLVDATHEDLAGLSATIADQETFQRHGLERPAFLTTTALKVSQDSQGHPVLALRSAEALTDLVVTLLVELHSPNGALIREYTILLDPPGLAPEQAATGSVSATPAQEQAQAPTVTAPAVTTQTSGHVVTSQSTATDPDIKQPGSTYTVARHDTLDRIVTIAGAHSRAARHRMMVAIFHANPSAFRANLNLLRSGATLHLPSTAESAAISAEAADQEFASQMAAWRASDHRTPVTVAAPPTPATAALPIPATAAVADAKPEPKAADADSVALTQRVESLEKSIDELKQDLKQPVAQQAPVPIVAELASAVAAIPPEVEAERAPPPPKHAMPLVPLVGGLGLALAAGIWFYRRRRHADDGFEESQVEDDLPIYRDLKEDRPVVVAKVAITPSPINKPRLNPSYLVEETKDGLQSASPSAAKGDPGRLKEPAVAPSGDFVAGDFAVELAPAAVASTPVSVDLTPAPITDNANNATTAVLAIDSTMSEEEVERELAFFDTDSDTTHVIIASGLNEPQPFAERRKNPVDVLRQALEREPERSDLRLKLLELYYTAAAQNRRAFLEVTRKLAKSEQQASTQEWSQIADMGRVIAPDDELFSAGLDKQEVA